MTKDYEQRVIPFTRTLDHNVCWRALNATCMLGFNDERLWRVRSMINFLHHTKLTTGCSLEGSAESWFDQAITRPTFPTAPIKSMLLCLQSHKFVCVDRVWTPDDHKHTRTLIPYHRELHRSSELATLCVSGTPMDSICATHLILGVSGSGFSK